MMIVIKTLKKNNILIAKKIKKIKALIKLMTRKAPSERGIFSAIIFFFRLDLSLQPP